MTIRQNIMTYHECLAGEHHRYRSWEHCFTYFRKAHLNGLKRDRHQAALQLAFYLASWGIYRGSSFLLQYTYTVHLGVINLLSEKRFSILWENEFGLRSSDEAFIPVIVEVIDGIKEAYRPFAPPADTKQPTDTLVSKIILGTLGCLPACDRYFVNGLKRFGLSYSYLNRKFMDRIFCFCRGNLHDLLEEQSRIEKKSGVHYPLMKLVDMCFWQAGFDMG